MSCLASTRQIAACALRLGALVCVLGLSSSAEAQEAQEIPTDVETFEYTVQEGDTCARIAGRFFGSRRRYDIIHLYNPNMGPPPHRLVAGSTLTLPRNTGPDARVTAVRRQVQARQPTDTDWRRANRGLGLFRGWRVNTLESSAAELTFQDRSRVQMRENTLVIIYGGSDESARRVSTTRAELERGTLRSHLGELRLQVDTPGGQTDLEGGAAVVSVDADGTSRLSNHEGGRARVRSSSGGAVRVEPGFGSAVVRGRRPTPPRPLPPAPTWVEGPTRFAGIASEGGTIRGEWNAVESARIYRVEVRPSGASNVIAAAEVPSTTRRFEIHRLPAGEYDVRLATLDNEFFESRPSDGRTISVALAHLIVPGQEPAEEALPDPSAAVETPRAIAGTIVAAPDGMSCSLVTAEASAAGPLGVALVTPGENSVQCSGPSGEFAPFDVNVVPLVAEPAASETEDEVAALTTGVSSELRFEMRSDIDVPDTLTFRSDALTVEEVRRDGAQWIARVVAPSAGEHDLLVTLGDTILSVINVVAVDPIVAEPAPAPPIPTDEPALIGQEALGIWQQPRLFGLRDPRPGQHAASAGVGSAGTTPFGEGSTTRLAVGIEADIAGVGRLVVGATPGIDFGGDSSFYAGFGLHHQHRGLSIYGEVASWFPTGGDQSIVLAPSLTLGLDLNERLLIRTRQGALIALSDGGQRLWASAYGIDVRVAGPFFTGIEANLAIGPENDELSLLFGAGLALGLTLDAARLSLAIHRSVTDDLVALQGEWVLALGVRVVMPGSD